MPALLLFLTGMIILSGRTPAPYSNIDAAMEAAENEIDVRQQALGAVILDAETGEVYVTCHWDDGIIPEEAYGDVDWDDGCPIDDIDESNYDPYAGCDMYEVEPFDFGGEF